MSRYIADAKESEKSLIKEKGEKGKYRMYCRAAIEKGILKVKVKKTPELENHNLVATFRLCGNENFAAAPVNENTYKIVLTNHLTEPAGWPFGEYSRIKHQFVIQTLGIATDYDKWSTSESIYYTGIMVNALYEYNKAHPGEPLTDENGLVVTF